MSRSGVDEERIILTLPDGKALEFPVGTNSREVAESIGPGLAKAALAGELNGIPVDLYAPLTLSGEFRIHTFDSDTGRDIFWHSGAHLLAHAVKRVFPEARLAIGPAVEEGFYYDIEFDEPISSDDFERIESEMAVIVKEDHKVTRLSMPVEEAKAFFAAQGESYKVRILEDLQADEEVGLDEGGEVSLYRQDDWTDLCRGPHVPSTGYLKSFKVMRLAGAYWRGDQRNEQLQRIYGVAFPKKKQLEEHLERIEEAKKRDHRRIGKEMDLFSFQEEAPGMAFWHPRGMILFNGVIAYIRRKLDERGYHEIFTPLIMNADLWRRSGHWDHYRENMYYTQIDEADFAVKPMNCPGACLVYRSDLRSYRDLPYKIAEMGVVHRHELSGVLHGLTRVRSFIQDDAHLYCTPDQIREQVIDTVEMVREVYADFGFEDYHIELSTRPEKYVGTLEMWEKAEGDLEAALEHTGLDYVVNEGDGAFYGPKIDFHFRDCLGRSWQLGTIQVDYSMPERFELEYVGSDGDRHRPIMIHRAIFGSIERFIAILIEHYAGDFPLWIAPRQVVVIPVGESFRSYAAEVARRLKDAGLRVEVDERDEKVGYKIREGETGRVPYMIVTGQKELESGTISVRRRKEGDLGEMPLDRFLEIAEEEGYTTP
ncbi:threonine--tRNA ligase [Candidatus Zixiibacteriota bacterium]